MQVLKQSTAAQIVYIYMVDLTDGFSVEVAAAVIPGGVYPTCYLTKNGDTPAALTLDANNFVELDGTNMGGWFKLILSAANTDTVGPLGIDVIKSTVTRHFAVAVYVSAALADNIKAETALIYGIVGTSGVALSILTKAGIVDLIWDELTSGHTTTGTMGKALTSAQAAADPWGVDPATYITDNTFGKAIARAIGGSGFSASTITCQDADDVAVEGVRVDVYSASTPSAVAFVTTGVTNSSGQISFYLRAGSYFIFRYKPGYAWTDPVTLTVT
jgi:hypothetical protein